jgi:hypothetical protein
MSGPFLSDVALAALLAESGSQALAEASSYRTAASEHLTFREEKALSVHSELGQLLILEASNILFDATDAIVDKFPLDH